VGGGVTTTQTTGKEVPRNARRRKRKKGQNSEKCPKKDCRAGKGGKGRRKLSRNEGSIMKEKRIRGRRGGKRKRRTKKFYSDSRKEKNDVKGRQGVDQGQRSLGKQTRGKKAQNKNELEKKEKGGRIQGIDAGFLTGTKEQG